MERALDSPRKDDCKDLRPRIDISNFRILPTKAVNRSGALRIVSRILGDNRATKALQPDFSAKTENFGGCERRFFRGAGTGTGGRSRGHNPRFLLQSECARSKLRAAINLRSRIRSPFARSNFS